MTTGAVERKHQGDLHASGLAFWMITLMHDNPLVPHLKNPYTLLEAAGLRPGQRVVEVGCGPGFFTIPAAKMVGAEGLVYAIDINPRAIERVKAKMRKNGIENVKPILANAADTEIPDGSVDVAFVFGLRYIAGGLNTLVSEMYRILKPGGLLSFEKTTGSEDRLIEELEKAGFMKTAKTGRILIFVSKRAVRA
jgi:ubiquinone/menaquinone biosynthesis C-methylase UbiE